MKCATIPGGSTGPAAPSRPVSWLANAPIAAFFSAATSAVSATWQACGRARQTTNPAQSSPGRSASSSLRAGASGSDAARKRAIARVVREVADYLGNTPAVARASYIDPRVIELYEDGHTIASVLGDLGKNCDFGDLATRGRAESAVVKLLARHAQ